MMWEQVLMVAVAVLGFPCAQGTYTGEETTYFVFNGVTIPGDFSDDAPQHVRVRVQLHLFAPVTRNTTQLRRAVRRALFAAGFTYPEEVDASDEREQHIAFECEVAEGAGV